MRHSGHPGDAVALIVAKLRLQRLRHLDFQPCRFLQSPGASEPRLIGFDGKARQRRLGKRCGGAG